MNKNLTRLLWRHYGKRLTAISAIALLAVLFLALSDTGSWSVKPGTNLFSNQITKWEVYSSGAGYGTLALYSNGLWFIYWLTGILLMQSDLKDNFNQFLFTSGYRRSAIYWHKLLIGVGTLLALTVLTSLIHFGIYWLKLDSQVVINLAWPGLLTSWAMGLATSLGAFAITWFASLIIGQTGPLLVTAAGFTFSLIGVGGFISTQTLKYDLSMSVRNWLTIGVWTAGVVVLLLWGAWLYNRLPLENNGKYLMFPGLRVPVYVVFVTYMTFLFAGNGEYLIPTLSVAIISAAFGYCWLWWPEIMDRRHRRHVTVKGGK